MRRVSDDQTPNDDQQPIDPMGVIEFRHLTQSREKRRGTPLGSAPSFTLNTDLTKRVRTYYS